ncbi:TetR/AcrR family transcriptional regulator [Actinoplanes sp. N902-109]|uniref:TetR/AcrR family transcriptional regulator n=1 Tax=Actinoplanes sp. (strain N902-109) TaxID=649831 RepID=UPI0003295B08|nr:TetR-like C-terminal domain-containing protein [Actinoplanes sp. N902-109]AGL17749.1 TetR family transcriptional regulator [Actinoplanes sp. N902-109]
MPTPERTSVDAIVRAGCELLETGGPARLTMQAVAGRVGVRAPSLYKRVRSRDDLIALVAAATARDLGARLAAVTTGGDACADLAVMLREVRAFAHARPAGFALILAPPVASVPLDHEALAAAVTPLLRVTTALAGADDALAAARTITAWAYGFLSMERAGAFSLGGDVGAAYEFGIAALADAVRRGGR